MEGFDSFGWLAFGEIGEGIVMGASEGGFYEVEAEDITYEVEFDR